MPRKSRIATTTKVAQAQLGPEDVARYFELEHEIAKLSKEYDALKQRIKDEIPEGNWPVDDYEVKRWDQIGSLKTDLFLAEYDVTDYPELYSDVPDLPVLLKVHPPENEPELYLKVPSPAAIKEVLSDDEKKTYFKQVPYLKITKN